MLSKWPMNGSASFQYLYMIKSRRRMKDLFKIFWAKHVGHSETLENIVLVIVYWRELEDKIKNLSVVFIDLENVLGPAKRT